MTGLLEPVPGELRRQLRLAVAQLRTAHCRTRFAPRLHVGEPGGSWASVAAEPPAGSPGYDDGGRVELVAALLLATRAWTTDPRVWLARPGQLEWQDDESNWLGPAARACAEAGAPFTFVVLTKAGWYDPRSGVGRSWRRLRLR